MTTSSLLVTPSGERTEFIGLIRDLCSYVTGVVADQNEPLFERLGAELPFRIIRFPSGSVFNGWTVPDLWRVHRAIISRDGTPVFDGRSHTLGVAYYSKSFQGELDFEELKPHLVTNPKLPGAYMFHCMWQYRPWAADWAFCVPHEVYRTLGPGRYQIDLVTSYEPGEMLVGECEHRGRSDKTIIFNNNHCHPQMANDGFAGTAILVRLFQWLSTQDTYYTYRLVIAPEHLGSVFYLRDQSATELERFVCGVFAEMPGTSGPITLPSTFLGDQPIDKAFRNVVRHYSRAYRLAGWREGAGNDETVWEAPGYEIPFVELTRSEASGVHFREYHSSLDTPDLMDQPQLGEFHDVLQRVVGVLEHNAVIHRHFDGLICLSNPDYDLYLERFDPTVEKNLDEMAERWGHLLDSLFRYFDGATTILDIAEKHDLPFDQLYKYLLRFQVKGLISLEFVPINREPISPRR